MEVQLVDLDDVIGVFERPIDVAVVEDALPGDIVAERFVQDGGLWFGCGYRVQQAGRGSYSTSITWAASIAASLVSASTTATASP